jgi:hypothetical protein
MTDSTSNVARPRFGQGGRLYREEGASPAAAAMGVAREAIEDQRLAEMMAPDPPPWADEPEPLTPPTPPTPPAPAEPPPSSKPLEKPKRRRRRGKQPEPEPVREVQHPPWMKAGKIEAPPEPKPPFDWREAVSTALELAGIALLVTTGFLLAVWAGTLIAGLSLVVLGVATSRNIGG